MSRNNEEKIVVTGAGGFLGSNLVNMMTGKTGGFVYALSSRGNQLQQANQEKRVQYCHKEDIFSTENEKILKDAIVVNCAFPRNTSGSGMADGLRYIQRLFDRAEECRAKAIINISSQSVYSQLREEPATEETPVCLENSYAVGKYATELMLESTCKRAGIPYTNLRMASLIGPGFDQRIVNRLVKQAVVGKTLRVVSSNQKFGFLDVEDAVRAILALLGVDIEQWKPVYNVGKEKEYHVEYIAQCIKNMFGRNGLPIPDIDVKSGEGFGSTGVAYRLLYEETGFEPIVDLNTSIQRILDQLQNVTDRNED